MDVERQKGWVNTSTCKKDSGILALDSPEFSRCKCSHCTAVHTDTSHWTSLCKPALHCQIQIGNRVLVNGQQSGSVKYIGDLNSSYTNDQVYIGVKLDDPVGEHDGMVNGKRFFSCPDHHGIIVPIGAVHTADGKPLEDKSVRTAKSFPNGHKSCKTKRNGLQSMLSKSWAQNRISSHSANFNRDSLKAPEVSTPPPDKDDCNGKECKQVETVYSNEGDMFVEDAEGEEKEEATCEHRLCNTPTKKRESEENDDHQRVQRSRSLQAGRPTTSAITCVESRGRPSTSPAQSFSGSSCVQNSSCVRNDARVDKKCSPARKLVESASSDQSGVLLTDVDSLPKYKPFDAITETSYQQAEPPLLAKPLSTGACCETNNPEVCCSNKPQSDELGGCKNKEAHRPPAPPAPAAITSCSQDSVVVIDEQMSLTSRLMSRLPPNEQTTPPEAEFQMEDVAVFDGVMGDWGEDVRAWLMASTYQRLKDALRRGEEEIKWQRKIRELEMSGRYPTLVRQFRVLRASIRLNRLATASVKTEIAVLKQRQWHKMAEVTSVRAKLEHEQEKTRVMCAKIMSYPSSNGKIKKLQKMTQNLLQGADI